MLAIPSYTVKPSGQPIKSNDMATATSDVKRDAAWNDNKVEDVAEKTSNSSGGLEAQHVELDESESARVLRKVDMRLVPMLSLLYLVAFIDRSNSMFESSAMERFDMTR